MNAGKPNNIRTKKKVRETETRGRENKRGERGGEEGVTKAKKD